MNDWRDLNGCHFRNFGFMPGTQASLHFMRFSPSTIGQMRFGTLVFVRSKTIVFRDVRYDQAILENVEPNAVEGLRTYTVSFTQGTIVVEAEDMISVSWNAV